LKAASALNHSEGAVLPDSNIPNELECEVATIYLLSSLEGAPTLLRPCDVIDDVIELANSTLLAPDLEGAFIARLDGAEFLLKLSRRASKQ
jgi:hypothetical protein